MRKVIAQGAEAVLYKTDSEVVKDRIKKSYRIKEIDEQLRKQRTKLEARLLDDAARAGVPTPKILELKKTELTFEFIDGIKVRDWLDKEKSKEQIKSVCRQIGQSTAKMHSANIIHGDLTTSNMIKKNDKVYFIDFGLGVHSKRVEDKAVDLHLFKECLVSKHHKIWKTCWEAFLSGYKPNQREEIIKRLGIVEARGRYKGKL